MRDDRFEVSVSFDERRGGLRFLPPAIKRGGNMAGAVLVGEYTVKNPDSLRPFSEAWRVVVAQFALGPRGPLPLLLAGAVLYRCSGCGGEMDVSARTC
jgi:hypothetical protein